MRYETGALWNLRDWPIYFLFQVYAGNVKFVELHYYTVQNKDKTISHGSHKKCRWQKKTCRGYTSFLFS